jgi:hypothetical protein
MAFRNFVGHGEQKQFNWGNDFVMTSSILETTMVEKVLRN